MKDLEIMIRMEELEEKLKLLHELEREKQKLKDDCKHNIVVPLDSRDCCLVDAVCIFCGKKVKLYKISQNVVESCILVCYNQQVPKIYKRGEKNGQIFQNFRTRFKCEN